MVLWEITLGTAYFLGLKRTYKLALKIQRKLISPKYPKIRQFAQRRTRSIFDMALRVHLKIQERDIEVGRNVGNWILRRLDKMKPSAQIKAHPPADNPSTTTSITKQANKSASQGGLSNDRGKSGNPESGRHLFTVPRNMWPKPLSSITMMKPAGSNVQHRQYGTGAAELFTVKYGKFGFGEVVRNDIRQYLLHH